jgi:hypothetical protein
LQSPPPQLEENEEVGQDGLPEEMRRMRPDMVFERRRVRPRDTICFHAARDEADLANEEKTLEIVEFSCPYGYVSRGRKTLERVYEEKKEKYLDLAMNLKRLRREEVCITVVIVSSIGAVYDRSLKDLQKVLKCTDREIRKLGKKMSETVFMGSMEILRQNAHEIRRGNDESANMLIEEEVE